MVGVAEKDDNDDVDDEGDTEVAATVASAKPTTTTKQQLKVEEKEARKLARRLARARERGYREVQERQARVKKLGQAEAHLQTEKLVAGKGRKRKIKAAEGGQPALYKWRRKRLS
eukprot:scaffold111_cov149-Amphora_coffeaeformis.AAC.2